MKQFKSKLPDAKGFQWKSDIDLKEKLTELLGNSYFEIREESEYLSLLEINGDTYAVFMNDYILLTDGGELIVFERDELDELYSEVH